MDSRLAGRIVEDLRKHGLTADGLLKEVGLRRSDVADPETRVPYKSILGLIERAAATLGDASYGLRLGADHRAKDGGLLGFVVLNSQTLMEALANLERYFRVVGDGEDIEIDRRGPRVALRFRETDPGLRGLRHNSEYIASAVSGLCRAMTGKRIAPVRAEFMHGKPNDDVAYDRYLGCPIRFQAEWDALVYDAATLELPVIDADARLLKVLERACRQLLGPEPRKQDLVRDVRELIVDRLPKGPVRLDTIAREVGLSGKTLERRLGERGHTFSVLLDDIRCDLAKRYLDETDYRLEQVAYLVGYAEAAALVRAFRRWTGGTPMRYRQQRSR